MDEGRIARRLGEDMATAAERCRSLLEEIAKKHPDADIFVGPNLDYSGNVKDDAFMITIKSAVTEMKKPLKRFFQRIFPNISITDGAKNSSSIYSSACELMQLFDLIKNGRKAKEISENRLDMPSWEVLNSTIFDAMAERTEAARIPLANLAKEYDVDIEVEANNGGFGDYLTITVSDNKTGVYSRAYHITFDGSYEANKTLTNYIIDKTKECMSEVKQHC